MSSSKKQYEDWAQEQLKKMKDEEWNNEPLWMTYEESQKWKEEKEKWYPKYMRDRHPDTREPLDTE